MGTEETRVTHIRGILNQSHRQILCGGFVGDNSSISFEHYWQSKFDTDEKRRHTIHQQLKRLPEPICTECIKE